MKLGIIALVLSALGYASAEGVVKNVQILSVSHLGSDIFLYLKDFSPSNGAQCDCQSHTWDTDSQLSGTPTYYVRWAQSDVRSNQFLSLALTAWSNGNGIKARFGNSQYIDNLFLHP